MSNKDKQLLQRAIALIERALGNERACQLKDSTGLLLISVQLEEDMDQLLRDARASLS